MDTSEDTYLDAENSFAGFNKEMNFKSLVMRYLEKIMNLSAVELRGGYNDVVTRIVGSAILKEDKYIPDAREVLVNAIDAYSDLLSPHFDAGMRKAEEAINKELASLDRTDVEQYKNKKVALKKQLFRQLASFLYAENYFERKRGGE